MAEPTVGDMDQDCAEMLAETFFEAHDLGVAEAVVNGELVDNVVRVTGARMFNEPDPIEAAAAEVVMRLKPK